MNKCKLESLLENRTQDDLSDEPWFKLLNEEEKELAYHYERYKFFPSSFDDEISEDVEYMLDCKERAYDMSNYR